MSAILYHLYNYVEPQRLVAKNGPAAVQQKKKLQRSLAIMQRTTRHAPCAVYYNNNSITTWAESSTLYYTYEHNTIIVHTLCASGYSAISFPIRKQRATMYKRV